LDNLTLLTDGNIAYITRAEPANLIIILDYTKDSNNIIIKVLNRDNITICITNVCNDLLASGSRGNLNIRLYDTKDDYKCVKELIGHTGIVFSLLFISKSNSLLSGSADNTIRLWELIVMNVVK
jgi:WD40 repeat protein